MVDINKSKKDSYMYSIFVILCIFCGFFYSYIMLLGFVVGIVYIISHREYSDVLCLMLLLFPFAEVFKIPIVATSLFTIFEIILVALWIFYEKKIRVRSFTCIFLFLVYCTCVSAFSGNIDIVDLIKLFMNMMLIYIFIESYKPEYFHRYVMHYEFGLTIASIIGLFKTSISGFEAMYSDLNYQWINGSRVLRFSATFSDPNYYTIAIIVALGLVIVYNESSEKRSKCITVFGIALFIFGCMTYSKSYYLMLGALAIIFLFILLRQGKIGRIMFVTLAVAILISTGVLSNNEVIQTALSRFDGVSMSDSSSLTTGRSDIWSGYMSYILSNLRITLLGNGIGAPYYLGGATHNMYIEIWYYVGIIGLIGYLVVISFLLSERRLLFRRSIFNYFLIVIVAALYFFLAGFIAYAFPFYMMMCWMVLNTDFSKNNKNEIGSSCCNS